MDLSHEAILPFADRIENLPQAFLANGIVALMAAMKRFESLRPGVPFLLLTRVEALENHFERLDPGGGLVVEIRRH